MRTTVKSLKPVVWYACGIVVFTMTRAHGQICLDPQQQFPAGIGGTQVAACDVDGDGDTDLVAPNPAGNMAVVLINLGGGSFAAPAAYPVGVDPEGVACADFNGDDHPDLAVTN